MQLNSPPYIVYPPQARYQMQTSNADSSANYSRNNKLGFPLATQAPNAGIHRMNGLQLSVTPAAVATNSLSTALNIPNASEAPQEFGRSASSNENRVDFDLQDVDDAQRRLMMALLFMPPGLLYDSSTASPLDYEANWTQKIKTEKKPGTEAGSDVNTADGETEVGEIEGKRINKDNDHNKELAF